MNFIFPHGKEVQCARALKCGMWRRKSRWRPLGTNSDDKEKEKKKDGRGGEGRERERERMRDMSTRDGTETGHHSSVGLTPQSHQSTTNLGSCVCTGRV